MGAGWYIAFERDLAEVSGALPQHGRALLFAQHHLEEIARELKLPLLKDFFSSNPAAVTAYLHEQGIEANPEELAAEEWFDPADALPTLQRLVAQLRDPPIGLGQVDKVRADLVAMVAALTTAAEQGVRFHIATGLPDLNADRDV